MTTARENAERLLERARRGLGRLLPADPVIADAHTHLGLDEDGMTLDVATALRDMQANGVSRALVFPLHEADRSPSSRAPNDRVLRWAAAYDCPPSNDYYIVNATPASQTYGVAVGTSR